MVNVLIVGDNRPLVFLWARSLRRAGSRVALANCPDTAADLLADRRFDILILDIGPEPGCALSVADMAQYRQPEARIIFVTSSSFFSDGSIFTLCANACACVPSGTAPEDLAHMAAHYARPPQSGARPG